MKIINLKTVKSGVDDLFELQELVIKNMTNKSWLGPCTYDEIKEEVEKDSSGFGLGIYNEDKLIAGILISPYCDKLRKILNMDLKEKQKTTTIDLVFVHPDYRGKGFQKILMKEAEIKISSIGYKYIIASVAPENTSSLNNFLNSGYEIKAEFFKKNFGERYILVKNL